MKTVFTNDMVAHVWAQQTQSEGRNGKGSYSFTGATLYSYRTPIARLASAPDGSQWAIVTSRGYSITTTRHTSRALGAVRQRHIIRVENVEQSLTEMLAELAETYNRDTERFRKHPRAYMHRLVKAGTILDFARAFNLPEPKLDMLSVEEIAAIEARAAARTAKAQATRDANEMKRSKLAPASIPDMIEAWRKGKLNRITIPWGWSSAALRKRGNVIQTSLGASFPVADAVAAYPQIKALAAQAKEQGAFATASIPLGNFRIERVNEDGSVVAGCHTVEWSEIEAMAKALGLEETANV